MEKGKSAETSGKAEHKRPNAVGSRVITSDFLGILQGMLISIVVAFLFFRSIVGLASAVVIVPFWVRQYRSEQQKKRKESISIEFKEYTMLVAGMLDTGYSLEKALRQSEAEHVKMFGINSVIVGDVHEMNQKIAMNVQVEKAFEEFASKLDLEEATNLSDILSFSKRSGGDYGRHIKNTAYKIEEKIMMQQEINTMTAEKRLEYRVMSFMPIGILAYISLTSRDFIAPLYTTMAGTIVMVISLIMYGMFLLLGKRIVEIDI